MTRALLAGTVVAVLAGAAAAAAGPVKATLSVTSNAPAVGAPWRWTVRTTSGGKPAAATVRIQILLGGAVVGCWKGGKMQACTGKNAGDPIPSKGTLSKPIRWTAQSRSVPLTFQALVKAGGKTRILKAPIRVS
jgi:hypothetical protein